MNWLVYSNSCIRNRLASFRELLLAEWLALSLTRFAFRESRCRHSFRLNPLFLVVVPADPHLYPVACPFTSMAFTRKTCNGWLTSSSLRSFTSRKASMMLMWPQGKVCVLLTPDHKVPRVVWKEGLTHLVSGRAMMWTSLRYQEAYLPRMVEFTDSTHDFLDNKDDQHLSYRSHPGGKNLDSVLFWEALDYQNWELAWVSRGFDRGAQHVRDSWLRLHTVDSITAADRSEWRASQKEAPGSVKQKAEAIYDTAAWSVFISINTPKSAEA